MDADDTLRDFPGRNRLIAAIDDAVSLGECQAITHRLRHSLCALMRGGGIELPSAIHQAIPAHYARRELHRSAEHGYALVAMTWAPGQGTPIHDHDGMWCVEGVWSGQLEIIQYDLIRQENGLYRFTEMGTLIAGTGSAGSLIPPHEYHAIRNASDRDIAVSLHVYAEPMTRCGVFIENAALDGYQRIEKQLVLDAAA